MLHRIRLYLRKAGNSVYAVLQSAILASSIFPLRKTEAISRYTSGRFYLAQQHGVKRRALQDPEGKLSNAAFLCFII